MADAFCKKHPTVKLEIRQGKRNQNFVVCPECKPAPGATPKTTPPAAAPAEQKQNGNESVPWYDRKLFG